MEFRLGWRWCFVRCVALWRRSKAVRLGAWLALICVVAAVMLVGVVKLLPFDDSRLRGLHVSTVVRDRDGQFLRAYLSRDDRWRIPADLERVSPWLVKATLATEDKRYYSHWGVDPAALVRATVGNLKAGSVVSGASTISMQVAGFALDSRERTLWRKLKQAFIALQLESHWTKEEILECYFTHASYGGNICGVEAASRIYFNKTAAELSLGEAAMLAGLPQSPERLRPDLHLAAALKRRDHVLARTAEDYPDVAADCVRSQKLRLNVGQYDVPVIAPHFCDLIRAQYPGLREPITTLELGVQRAVERSLDTAIAQYRTKGISNGAIVVMANATGEVVALAGSADYWNRYDHGQVNGAFGFRSPGSTLKPFIFARAMDEGLLSPDETLYDVPVTISGYSPMNYDRRFRGPVAASKALAWSLNIPAIDVLKRVGVGWFKDSLMLNDIPIEVNPKGDQGLSLAIGTCSVRLIDLTRAYASLAADGRLPSEVWLPGSSNRVGRQWLSPEAASAVLQILGDENIRAPEDIDVSLAGLRGVAWKTGTSNGFRDAWTFAVTERYTIGVWFGNMDGKPSRALVGGQVAAPVALSLAKSLGGGKSGAWIDKRDPLETVEACLDSGLPMGDHCPDAGMARVIRGAGRLRQCSVHEAVRVEESSGYALCSRCSGGKTWNTRSCVEVPAEFANWLRLNLHPMQAQLTPAHNPDCATARLGDPPVIISPQPAKEIILLEELPAEFQKIALAARTADPRDKLYWFINGQLAGTTQASESLQILPKPGQFSVRCVDEQGRSSETWFSVQLSSIAEKQVGWSRLSDSN